ncbi:MAG: DUF4367 domain-containing protein [Ruminococcaceae bacterium]|nr:DUF4367 domain-containing protein [Oscillospiraceae bacterium]
MIRNNMDSAYEAAAMRMVIQPLVEEDLALFDRYNTVPHTYSGHFRKRLRYLFRRNRTVQYGRTAAKWGRRAAVCFAAVIVAGMTACAAIRPLRENVTEAIVSLYTHYVGIRFETDGTAAIPKKPVYLPEGYERILETDTGGYYTACYRKGALLLEFLRYPDGMGEVVYDNLNHAIENVEIDGIRGVLLVGTNRYPTILTWSEHGYTYSIHGYADREELIRIAENIQ